MGRNEIRLRRQRMSSGHIARHRNYDELMEKHQRHIRVRRIAIACIYLLLIISLLAIYIVTKRQQNLAPANRNAKGTALVSAGIAVPIETTPDCNRMKGFFRIPLT